MSRIERAGIAKAYLELEEVERLEKAATNSRNRLLIRFLSRLGCRISEALGLTVQDVDLQQGTVAIQHLKTRLKLICPECDTRLGRKHVFCPRCGAKVEKVVAKAMEHRRLRTLHLDRDTLKCYRSTSAGEDLHSRGASYSSSVSTVTAPGKWSKSVLERPS